MGIASRTAAIYEIWPFFSISFFYNCKQKYYF
jgi:hypothetical protein